MSSQTVLLDGHKVEVPSEVFGWLVEFHRAVSRAVQGIESSDDPVRRQDALRALAHQTVQMGVADPCDPEAASIVHEDWTTRWVRLNQWSYNRMVYDVLDVRVRWGRTGRVRAPIQSALAEVIRADICQSNWQAVYYEACRQHTESGDRLYTVDEAAAHAREYGFIVKRKYGYGLVEGFLDKSRHGRSIPAWVR